MPNRSKTCASRLAKRSNVVALLTAALAIGCGGAQGGDAGAGAASTEYVVERSSADGVDTVRSVSGSRWGAGAQLVEEIAIGSELADDEYLFGSITAAWATDDRIYVVDAQVPAVRAYDLSGNYLFDVGQIGQGPGEYSRPLALAVTTDGRVLVTDLQGARLNVYDRDGAHLDDWSLGSPQSATGLLLTYDDEVFTRILELPQATGGKLSSVRMGMRAVGPEGLTGEPVFPPATDYEPPTTTVEAGGNSLQMAIVPFTPSFEWAMAPGGEMISGVGDQYHFDIQAPDGRHTAVERTWDPVPVQSGEIAFRAEVGARPMRGIDPDLTIPASDMPRHKPAFTRFNPDRSGRVWVARQGPSVADDTCSELDGGGSGMVMTMSVGKSGGGDVSIGSAASLGSDDDYHGQCWANTHMFDVFDLATGEFLGTVPAPEIGFVNPLFVAGDVVLAAVTDAAGTVRLKKYRLVIG